MNISIEYCMESNYKTRALGLRNSLDSKFGILAEMRSSSGGACEPECPVEAIFEETEVPAEWDDYIRKNYEFFGQQAP